MHDPVLILTLIVGILSTLLGVVLICRPYRLGVLSAPAGVLFLFEGVFMLLTVMSALLR